jgi:multisubunit Na+/H+ antiporter MnhC subunit
MIMRTLNKLFLALALVLLAFGFFVAHSGYAFHPLLGLSLPTGAILMGLFLIFKVLEKETAIYDEQQQARARSHTSPIPPKSRSQKTGEHRKLTHAHSH